jgi:hypothetical protein
MVKVNVSHEGHGYHFSKRAKSFGCGKVGNGEAQKIAAHTAKPFNAPYQIVPKVGKRKAILPHGLNGHRKTTSQSNGPDVIKAADFYLTGHNR